MEFIHLIPALVLMISASFSSLSHTLPSEFSLTETGYNELESKEMARALFQKWKEDHGKIYNHVEEAEERFLIFRNNLKYIVEKNSKRWSLSGHVVGLNKFADLSNEEFRMKYLSKVRKPVSKVGGGSSLNLRRRSMVSKMHSCKAPSSLDWRKYGAVTGVKDQGNCGKS